MSDQSYAQHGVLPAIIKGHIHVDSPAGPISSHVAQVFGATGYKIQGLVEPTTGLGANLLAQKTLGVGGTFVGNFVAPLTCYYRLRASIPMQINTGPGGLGAGNGGTCELAVSVTYPDGSSRTLALDYTQFDDSYINNAGVSPGLRPSSALRVSCDAYLPAVTVINFIMSNNLGGAGWITQPVVGGAHVLASDVEITILGG